MRRHFVRLLPLGVLLASAATAQAPVVYRIPVNGTIENGLAPYVARALREARAAGAVAAFLDIDTPGGRIDAAERIVDAVRNAEVPVYAYVNPRALSAGALIALATREIYMRPGGVIGAATPVDGQGARASDKVVSAMRAEFRALAETRGLDPRVAEAMVDERVGVPGLAEPGRLLTLSTGEALQVKLAAGQADGQAALLAAIGHPDAAVVTPPINWAERAVRFFTHPLVAPLLLSLGMLGLIFELKTGAFGLGGLVSLAALGLFFGSSLLLGLAGWEEVLLLGGGIIALGVEVFLLPGFGIAGVLGIVLIGASVVLALTAGAPTAADVLQALAVLGAAIAISVAVVYAWLRHLPTSARWEGLLLRGAMKRDAGYVSAPARPELVGKSGIALTPLRPVGTVGIGDERIDAVTEGEWVPQGAAVEVTRSEGYRLVVRQIPSLQESARG